MQATIKHTSNLLLPPQSFFRGFHRGTVRWCWSCYSRPTLVQCEKSCSDNLSGEIGSRLQNEYHGALASSGTNESLQINDVDIFVNYSKDSDFSLV